MRRDFALSEPVCVCRIKRGDEVASSFENLSVATDRVLAVDEIEDRVDTIRVRRAQCADYVDAFGVVNFFGTEAASLVGVAENGCDDMRAAGPRHLHA